MKRRNVFATLRPAVTIAFLGAAGARPNARVDAPIPVRIALFASDVPANIYDADELGYIA